MEPLQQRLTADVLAERVGIERDLARALRKYYSRRRYNRRHGRTTQLAFLRKQAE